jgi:hypothetical protein
MTLGEYQLSVEKRKKGKKGKKEKAELGYSTTDVLVVCSRGSREQGK